MKDHALQNIHYLFLRISVVFFELNIFKGVLMVGYQYPQYNIKVFNFFFIKELFIAEDGNQSTVLYVIIAFTLIVLILGFIILITLR